MAKKSRKSRARAPGGSHASVGRPVKQNKEEWGQITCVLKHGMIKQLKDGAGGGRFFGDFLQRHLERFPPPTHAEYLALVKQPPKRIRTMSAARASVLKERAEQRARLMAAFAKVNWDEVNDRTRKARKSKPLAHTNR